MNQIKDIAVDSDISYADTNQIDELLSLFEMHNLMPELSKHEHVFANSLAMLVSSLNWNGHAAHLFDSLPYSKDREIDLLDILNTMAHLGYESHEMHMKLQEIDNRLMPCLFIPARKNAPPLVLLNKSGDIITAFNSADRKKVKFRAKNISGEAFFFEKINPDQIAEDAQTKQSAGLSWFSIVFSRLRPVLKEIFVASFFINVLALAMPIFIMSIYDRVIGSGSTETLYYLVVGVAIAVTAEAMLRIIRLKSIVWLGVRLDNIVSNTIFERLLLIKASYTEGASISAQISRLKSFESIRKFFTGPLFAVIVEIPFTLILLVAIWFLTGPLVYIPIIVVILFTIMLLYYQSRLRVSLRAAGRASSHRQQYGMETFIKMHALHHNGMARNWWQRYKEKLSRSSRASFKSSMVSANIETAAHTVSVLSGVAIVTFGVGLIWEGSITIGALVATMILVWRILGPIQTLCSMLPRVEQLKNSIEQINRLVSIEIERPTRVLKRPIENLIGNIKLSNIGLRYSTEIEPLFVGLDIDVQAGEVVAITGPNGAGKTSILKLISGLYRSQTGIIRIDGINIRQLEPIELRRYINYLSQVPNFFEGTIKENLLLANPLATDEDIMNALEKATALDELERMEDGIETMIFGNNPPLPTGYGYILNLAKTFLIESNILLLDELPNAALNEDVGVAYRNLILDSKKQNKTVFFVSQRTDYLSLADRVIVLKSGGRPQVIDQATFKSKLGK